MYTLENFAELALPLEDNEFRAGEKELRSRNKEEVNSRDKQPTVFVKVPHNNTSTSRSQIGKQRSIRFFG